MLSTQCNTVFEIFHLESSTPLSQTQLYYPKINLTTTGEGGVVLILGLPISLQVILILCDLKHTRQWRIQDFPQGVRGPRRGAVDS